MTEVCIAIEGLPESVVERLKALVTDVRFWSQQERERLTPAEVRDSVRDIERKAHDLARALGTLHVSPRAHIVANLPAGELRRISEAVLMLEAAAQDAQHAVQPERGNVQVGVPRYAAERVIAIFRDAGLPTTVTNNEERRADSLVTQALKAVLYGAGRPLSTTAVNKYLIEAM